MSLILSNRFQRRAFQKVGGDIDRYYEHVCRKSSVAKRTKSGRSNAVRASTSSSKSKGGNGK